MIGFVSSMVMMLIMKDTVAPVKIEASQIVLHDNTPFALLVSSGDLLTLNGGNWTENQALEMSKNSQISSLHHSTEKTMLARQRVNYALSQKQLIDQHNDVLIWRRNLIVHYGKKSCFTHIGCDGMRILSSNLK